MDRSSQPENRRRRSKFTLYRHKYLIPALIGSLVGAIVIHFMLYYILNLCGYAFHVSSNPVKDEPNKDIERLVVLTDESKNDVPELAPDPLSAPEELPHEPLPSPEALDPEDFKLEEVVIAPGETDIGQTDSSLIRQMEPESAMSMDVAKIKAGLPEPSSMDASAVTANPIKIAASTSPKDINPDEWYKNKLIGAGGKDDSGLPDGTKSFDQLLAQKAGSLSSKSGHARIGADLLFEYNKTTMKNSARIGLLQLASLIFKNPDTVFIIEGHTDGFGSLEYNRLLSLMRANAVRMWLESNGINLKNIYIRACGAERPVVSLEGDKNAQAANRRVEIHMRKKDEAIPENVHSSQFKVDMKTPIATQLAYRVPSQTPTPKKSVPPSSKPIVSATAQRTPQKPTPVKNNPAPEAIPLAEPIEDIPHAEEIIPDAEAL